MTIGTVKWFDDAKGYGFIKPTSGGNDVFVHASSLKKAGIRTLQEGQQISYTLSMNQGKQSATNLKIVKSN